MTDLVFLRTTDKQQPHVGLLGKSYRECLQQLINAVPGPQSPDEAHDRVAPSIEPVTNAEGLDSWTEKVEVHTVWNDIDLVRIRSPFINRNSPKALTHGKGMIRPPQRSLTPPQSHPPIKPRGRDSRNQGFRPYPVIIDLEDRRYPCLAGDGNAGPAEEIAAVVHDVELMLPQQGLDLALRVPREEQPTQRNIFREHPVVCNPCLLGGPVLVPSADEMDLDSHLDEVLREFELMNGLSQRLRDLHRGSHHADAHYFQ